MTAEETNLLTLKPYFKITSTVTKQIYIDKEMRCYLFDTEREALQFCEQIENTQPELIGYIKQGPFISLCYGLGINFIRIKTASNQNFVNIKLEKADARQQYYNRHATVNILRLKQTMKMKYARELKEAFFICPILIKERATKDYPSIRYAYATFSDDTKYYLLFTTLYEFDKWNKTQDGKFEPYQTSLRDFSEIRSTNAIIINPLSDMLILTNSQIAEILRFQGEKNAESIEEN